MKLDRNVNRGGRGKYALVNMRKLIPLLDAATTTPESRVLIVAFESLCEAGIITLGTESPGDQFFVMKYKDKFTPAGLQGYAKAIHDYWPTLPDGPKRTELAEYCDQMIEEFRIAEESATRIPD